MASGGARASRRRERRRQTGARPEGVVVDDGGRASGANMLDEPEKSVIKSWRKGVDPLPPRCAVAIIWFRGESHVLDVDLGEGDGAVTPLPVPASGYPMMSMDEQTSLSFVPFKDAALNASLRRRGIRASDVACLPISLGWYGPAEENR
uniref:Amine oxidase n=1 Tax=Oryza meridionalis TaxID=40149 RepID=A0A0E0DPS6_9ORYZ